MNHKKSFNKLNRNASHRKALMRNMMTVLFKHERIITTKAKAIEVRRFAEKEITRAKVDSVHNRRQSARKIMDDAVLAKLYTDIGVRMKDRAGGYTRILKIGFRKQDAADMVVLELVDRKEDDAKAAKKAAIQAKKAEKVDKAGKAEAGKAEKAAKATKPEVKAEKPAKTAKAEKPAKAEKAEKKAADESKAE
jgi:large subunit ribosomal protein L17